MNILKILIKAVFTAFIVLVLSQSPSFAQNMCNLHGSVFVEDSPALADFHVYQEESEAFADVLVFTETNRLYADRPAIWHFTDNRDFADFTIWYTDKEATADFSVHFIDVESFAGCNQ